jgi:hypothetical protein
MACCEEFAPLVDTPEPGLNTSPGPLFGGVKRLPTLAIVVGGWDDCEAFTVLKD